MSTFDDIELEWNGSTYKIAARKVMGAIARIEDVITLDELRRYAERKTAPLAKIAMAYGAVLRFAGAQVDDDQVYAGMFGSATAQSLAMDATTALLSMMLPPEMLASKDTPPGNGRAPAKAGKGSNASRKPTRRRSAAGA